MELNKVTNRQIILDRSIHLCKNFSESIHLQCYSVGFSLRWISKDHQGCGVYTAWKVFRFFKTAEFFLVSIFLYSYWIRRLRSKSAHSVQIQENTDQKNSVFRHFSPNNIFKNITYIALFRRCFPGHFKKVFRGFYFMAFVELLLTLDPIGAKCHHQASWSFILISFKQLKVLDVALEKRYYLNNCGCSYNTPTFNINSFCFVNMWQTKTV